MVNVLHGCLTGELAPAIVYKYGFPLWQAKGMGRLLMDPESVSSDLYRQFDVLVCTGELVFSGSVRCDFSQRLIDALNEGVRGETRSKIRDFLPMSDVTVTDLQGGITTVPCLHISKNNIIFVAQAKSITPGKPLTSYPFKEKLPVTIMAYVAGATSTPYTVYGCIFIDTWGKITDTLEIEERFIPLTQVQIDPAMPGNKCHFDFVALNKERIISIGEMPGN